MSLHARKDVEASRKESFAEASWKLHLHHLIYTKTQILCIRILDIYNRRVFGTSSKRVLASRAKPKVLADFRGSRAEAARKPRGSPNSQTCTLAHFCSKLPAIKQLPACVPVRRRQLAINPTNHTRNFHKIEKHAPRLGRGSKSSKTSNAEARGSHI